MRKRMGLAVLLLIICVWMATASSEWSAAAADAAPECPGETVLYGMGVSPYLLPGGTGDTVILRWVSGTNRPVSVFYGPKTEEPLAPDALEKQTVDGVAANHSWYFGTGTYYYTLELPVSGEERLVYGLSEPGDFPDTFYEVHGYEDGVLSVFLTSDSHISNGEESERLNSAFQKASSMVAPELICHAGDINESDRIGPNVLISNASCFRRVPTMAVCGNHDVLEGLYEFFDMPNLQETRPNPYFTAKLMDYHFVRENVLFLGLSIKSRDYSSHEAYIRQATAEHPECDWAVAVLHYSLFSNGSHGKDEAVLLFQKNLAPVFSECGIDLVISGHDHEYDRSLLYVGEMPVAGTDGVKVEKLEGETMYISLPTAVGTKFYSRKTDVNEQPAAEAMKFEPGYVLATFSRQAIVIRAFSLEEEMQDIVVLTQKE